MSRKQIINGTNKFQSKEEKERSQNYTKKWITIINQSETKRFTENVNNPLYKSVQM